MVLSLGTYYTITILNSLLGISKFYHSVQTKLDINGLLGLRIIEGQLSHILIDKPDLLKQKSLELTRMLTTNSSTTANLAMPYVFERNHEAFSKLRILISKPWSLYRDLQFLDRKNASAKSATLTSNFKVENFMDACLAELLSSEDDCKRISTRCLNKVFSMPVKGISQLLRQILYLQVSEQIYCDKLIGRRLEKLTQIKEDISELYERNCNTLLQILDDLFASSASLKRHIELFLEIEFACGGSGFLDFAKKNFLDNILSLQDLAIGCFRDERNSCDSRITALAAGVLCFYLRSISLLKYNKIAGRSPVLIFFSPNENNRKDDHGKSAKKPFLDNVTFPVSDYNNNIIISSSMAESLRNDNRTNKNNDGTFIDASGSSSSLDYRRNELYYSFQRSVLRAKQEHDDSSTIKQHNMPENTAADGRFSPPFFANHYNDEALQPPPVYRKFDSTIFASCFLMLVVVTVFVYANGLSRLCRCCRYPRRLGFLKRLR